MLAFSYAFYPAVWMLEKITKAIIKITKSDYHPPALTEEEIKGIIEQGHRDEAIEKQERDLVQGALKFDDTVIRSVMMPRTRMLSLSEDTKLMDAADIIHDSGHSRIPIYGQDRDDIKGILHVRDILKHLKDPELQQMKLGEFVREPIFVSQDKRMSDLLKQMQAKNMHMAIVVDEFGGVEGLVTLEDLIEEIVGEIHDETDLQKPMYQKIDDKTIITSGDIEIDTLNEVFKTKIPRGEDYSTLNGFLHERLRDLPKPGDEVKIDSLEIKIEKVAKNKPSVIRISYNKELSGEEN